MNERICKLKKIQECKFAAYDLLLYLDTHPTDKSAFEMYKTLIKKLTDEKKEFEARFGSLDIIAAADRDYFDWTDNPWPWDKQGQTDLAAPGKASNNVSSGCCCEQAGRKE